MLGVRGEGEVGQGRVRGIGIYCNMMLCVTYDMMF